MEVLNDSSIGSREWDEENIGENPHSEMGQSFLEDTSLCRQDLDIILSMCKHFCVDFFLLN